MHSFRMNCQRGVVAVALGLAIVVSGTTLAGYSGQEKTTPAAVPRKTPPKNVQPAPKPKTPSRPSRTKTPSRPVQAAPPTQKPAPISRETDSSRDLRRPTVPARRPSTQPSTPRTPSWAPRTTDTKTPTRSSTFAPVIRSPGGEVRTVPRITIVRKPDHVSSGKSPDGSKVIGTRAETLTGVLGRPGSNVKPTKPDTETTSNPLLFGTKDRDKPKQRPTAIRFPDPTGTPLEGGSNDRPGQGSNQGGGHGNGHQGGGNQGDGGHDDDHHHHDHHGNQGHNGNGHHQTSCNLPWNTFCWQLGWRGQFGLCLRIGFPYDPCNWRWGLRYCASDNLWYQWHRRGFCSNAWITPLHCRTYWPWSYPNNHWLSWGSTWNTTYVVYDTPVAPLPEPEVPLFGYDLPVQVAELEPSSVTNFERADGTLVIASRSQTWEILATGDGALAAEVFAAFLEEAPEANDLLLGYTLALAVNDRIDLAGLVLEEVLARDAFVLLEVPMTVGLQEQLRTLKLGILLDARGTETSFESIMLLAGIRTILGEDRTAVAALKAAERIHQATPGSRALGDLLDRLDQATQLSMRTSSGF